MCKDKNKSNRAYTTYIRYVGIRSLPILKKNDCVIDNIAERQNHKRYTEYKVLRGNPKWGKPRENRDFTIYTKEYKMRS